MVWLKKYELNPKNRDKKATLKLQRQRQKAVESNEL